MEKLQGIYSIEINQFWFSSQYWNVMKVNLLNFKNYLVETISQAAEK